MAKKIKLSGISVWVKPDEISALENTILKVYPYSSPENVSKIWSIINRYNRAVNKFVERNYTNPNK